MATSQIGGQSLSVEVSAELSDMSDMHSNSLEESDRGQRHISYQCACCDGAIFIDPQYKVRYSKLSF